MHLGMGSDRLTLDFKKRRCDQGTSKVQVSKVAEYKLSVEKFTARSQLFFKFLLRCQHAVGYLMSFGSRGVEVTLQNPWLDL